MVEIKIGISSIIIATILGAGYLMMFFSVIMQSSKHLESADLGDYMHMQAQLERTVKEAGLMQGTLTDMKKKLIIAESTVESMKKSAADPQVNTIESRISRPGVIILGMHRSGTSVVGGLMSKMGLKTGGPLLEAASDNEKGFFERVDVVLQNDIIMGQQNVYYSYRTSRFNYLQGIKDILNNRDNSKYFNEGRRALNFLNDELSYPWMLKDPRLCITLKTWIPFLNFIPSILFIYRHPYDVALSMHNRETEHFKMGKGMKLWYIYNKKAILSSSDLCRVVGSHRNIMKSPKIEFDRIYDELNLCGLKIPHKVKSSDVNDFIDAKLQHGKNGKIDDSCSKDLSTITPPDKWIQEEPDHVELYRSAMKAYCAMEDGTAFLPEFEWDDRIIDE